MGSPITPTVTGLVMEGFEEKSLLTFHHSPPFWAATWMTSYPFTQRYGYGVNPPSEQPVSYHEVHP